jgi:A/G-specific adenine glycosylase
MQRFTNLLLNWHKTAERDLPWKQTSDPYKIWISEIILQQTRVDQGLPYYLRFIDRFPTISDLANAVEDDVLKYWEGLGYYSRARNLHYTAKYISSELNGIFPNSYESLLKLKGVGPYTAAAIASFAYNLSHPVIDGNVLRVISRYYGIHEPVDLKTTMDHILELLKKLIPSKTPGTFNQAIMDFGATLCTPKNYQCTSCPMQSSCCAYNNDEVNLLPIKAKFIKKTTRHLHYFLINCQDSFAIQRRSSGIWKGLYQLPLIETENNDSLDLKSVKKLFLQEGTSIVSPSGFTKISEERHILTHQTLLIKFYSLKVKTISNLEINLVEKEKLSKFAFPIVIKNLLANILKIE